MDLLKIFKKYQFVILFVVLLYFLTCSSENLSASPNREYTNIIKTICHSVSNKEGCVDSYKNKCIEMECRGKAGTELGNCNNSCTSISL